MTEVRRMILRYAAAGLSLAVALSACDSSSDGDGNNNDNQSPTEIRLHDSSPFGCFPISSPAGSCGVGEPYAPDLSSSRVACESVT